MLSATQVHRLKHYAQRRQVDVAGSECYVVMSFRRSNTRDLQQIGQMHSTAVPEVAATVAPRKQRGEEGEREGCSRVDVIVLCIQQA
eukprot:20837-Heterococcus_DN1.PRE.1